MDWQAQQGLERAKWGLKYNIMATKNHYMYVSFSSRCERLILGLKHIVPGFEHDAAQLCTSDMPAVPSKKFKSIKRPHRHVSKNQL